MSHVYAWDTDAAAKQAAETGKPVGLVRGDGTHSGLCVWPDGTIHRLFAKPLGKAARKQHKRLRQELRRLQETGASESVQRVVARRMDRLCRQGV